MKTKWLWVLGIAIAAMLMGDNAKADHRHHYRGGYGYSSPGYGYRHGGYGYGGFYNRADHYHYTHPRVTTGYGFGRYSQPSYYRGGYYGRGYNYGRGGVSVRYPGGGVNVGWGHRGGGVRVYRGYRGVNVGW